MSFVAFEGGEGVGKTTQMNLLKERLPILFPDRTFCFTREPGGSPFAEIVRSVIMNDASDADGKTMFGLFAAARADHLRRVIVPKISEGVTVITDRFAAATYAYQAVAMENPIDKEFFWKYYHQLEVIPELTIVLDMDPEISQSRVKARNGEVTHFDTRPPEFHHKLREGYTEFVHRLNWETEPRYPQTVLGKIPAILIDASRSVDEVHEDIIDSLRKNFSN